MIYFNVRPDVTALLKENLSLFIDRLQTVNSQIWDEIATAGIQEYQQFTTDTPIVTWELLAGEVVYKERTLVDALQKLLDEVLSI